MEEQNSVHIGSPQLPSEPMGGKTTNVLCFWKEAILVVYEKIKVICKDVFWKEPMCNGESSN
jgi:hypothetical protein